MDNTSKRRQNNKAKITVSNAAMDYINDPYFVKKREEAAAFLRKAWLPESFKKPQNKQSDF